MRYNTNVANISFNSQNSRYFDLLNIFLIFPSLSALLIIYNNYFSLKIIPSSVLMYLTFAVSAAKS